MNVLVTGASSSVGKVVVEKFLAATWWQTSALASSCGHTVTGTSREQVDFYDESSIRSFAAGFWKANQAKKVDALVMLAGELPGKRFEDYDFDEINRVTTTNFSGQAFFVREMLPYLSDGAHVLFMASLAGERGSYDPIYAASKAAVIALVKSLATNLAPRIRVNAVSPGLIAGSTMHSEMSEARRQHHVERTPTRRLVTVDEVAGAVVQLCCSPAWSGLNGQVIRVDGGSCV